MSLHPASFRRRFTHNDLSFIDHYLIENLLTEEERLTRPAGNRK